MFIIRIAGRFALALGTLAALALDVFAQSELAPAWLLDLPAGAALGAGIQGMVVDAAGTSYVTGVSGDSLTDVFTAAVSAEGELLWGQVFDGPAGGHDQARGCALAPDGVLWVTGNTPGPGNYASVLLLGYDAATGALLAQRTYSSAPFTSEFGAAVAADAAGNVYVGGGTRGDGSDVMLLKFDAAGALVWKRTWDGPASAPYSQDTLRELSLDPSGNPLVLLEGLMASRHPDYVVVRYGAADGATLWEAAWGGPGEDAPRDMELDAAGDVYVTGTALDVQRKLGTIRLRGSDGQLLWQALDVAGLDDTAVALALDGLGGVYVTGAVDPDGNVSNFNDDFYTLKRAASDGALVWTHRYGAACVGCLDAPSDVLATGDGHVLVAGSSNSSPYTSDRLTLVLDAATGLETRRGSVASDPNHTASAGQLHLDADHDLYAGGHTYDANTGRVEVALLRYDALAPAGVAPLVFCPTSIAVKDPLSGPPGEIVTFAVSAVDDLDPFPSVVCAPPSGSLFPRGTTVVTVTATDSAGNRSVCSFPVTVQAAARRGS